jgi:carboxylesterase
MNLSSNNKPRLLVIHGFGGGVHEVDPLAKHLTDLGYKVACPVLKGHSQGRKEMVEAKHQDWVESAEHELLRLKESGDEIILIGFSMGGLIAFNLACAHDVKAVVTINTPIYYWNLWQVLKNLADDIKNKRLSHTRRYLRAKKNSPLRAMAQFLLLLRKTKRKLRNITCPLLIIQAEDDDTVRRKSVDYINEHVSSENKRIRYFCHGGHLILLSPAAKQIMSCVEDFITK